MIITGGYNVYPREVEDVAGGHPAVAGAAVVGAPDATWVEAVTAFVTLRPGAQPTKRAARRRPYGRLAGYKVPKAVHVVDACRCRRSARSCAAPCASRCGRAGERPT